MVAALVCCCDLLDVTTGFVFDDRHVHGVSHGSGHFGYSLDLSGGGAVWIGAPKERDGPEIRGTLTKCDLDFDHGSSQCLKRSYAPITDSTDSLRDQLMGITVRGGKYRGNLLRDVCN